MIQYIQFGSKRLDFKLEFSCRKTLGITVTPDMEVLVVAPVDSCLEKIRMKIKKKAPWIIKQQSFFLSFHPKTPFKRFVGGETHLYLGRQYRVKIVIAESNEFNDEVKLKGQFLMIYTQDKRKVKPLLENWYLEKAKQYFNRIALPLFTSFVKRHRLQNDTFNLSIRNMPTRWGSCTPNGKIILNPELIKAPKGSIEYVIIHELCHLIHRDHTQKFIDLQTKEMPEWEKWKTRLEKILA